MQDIKGKRAFLTGASRGIGQQIAFGLAELGCHLILQARTEDNLQETLNTLEAFDIEVDYVTSELSDVNSVKEMLESVDKIGKSVDIVYNCAGSMSQSQDIYGTERSEWDRIMQINFYAVVSICEHFMPNLVKQGFGRIVNVSSGIANQPALAPYSVSKAAVDRYTRDLSKVMKEQKVLMNVVDPGWIKTDMGGPNAFSEVSSVLPGMLVPVLIDSDGPVSKFYMAQEYVGLELDEIDYSI